VATPERSQHNNFGNARQHLRLLNAARGAHLADAAREGTDAPSARTPETTADRATAERLRQLAAIVEQSTDAIVSYAPDGTITSWNPGAERLYGFTAAEVLGRHPDDFPPSSGEISRLFTRAAAGETVQNYETVHFTRDGQRRVVAVTISPIRDVGGALSGFSGIARDITERKQTEETLQRQNGYLAALHEVTLGLMDRVEVAGLIEAIVTRAAALLNANDGFVCLVSADGDALELAATTGHLIGRHASRLRKGEGMAGTVWQTGEPLVIDDYTAWEGSVSTNGLNTAVRATVGIPLRSAGAVVGVLGLSRSAPGQRFDEDEVELLAQFARLATLALENARLHEAARGELEERRRAETRLRRENAYRAALHEITLGLMQRHEMADLLDTIVTRAAALLGTAHGFVNLVTADGVGLETTAGTGMFRGQIGTRMERGQGLAGSVLATGEPLLVPDYTVWCSRLPGSERDLVHACGAAPLRAGAEVVGVIGLAFTSQEHEFGEEELAVLVQFAQLASIAYDNARLYQSSRLEIDERRRAEDRLRRENAYRAALHETALGLINHISVADVLTAIIARSTALLDGDHGFVDLVTPDGRWLELTAATGLFKDEIGRRFRPGEGVVGRVWASGEPLAIGGYHRWQGRLPGGVRDVVRSAVGVPLKSGEQVIGVLGIMRTQSETPFGQEEIDTLGQFARLAVVALDNARLYQEARAAEEELRRQLDFTGAITSNLGEGVLALDGEGRVTLANPAAVRLLGWEGDKLIGRPIGEVLPAPPAAGAAPEQDDLADALGRSLPVRVDDAVFVRRDGAPLPASFSASPIRSAGRVTGTVIAFHDITERKAQTAALEHQAQHDALTGLPNRVLLRDRLEQGIRTAGREALPLALLVMDLDGFKEVNDTLGHQMGDVLLQHVAHRLQDALRSSDTVARLGGDEFAVLLPGDAQAGAQIAAQKLLAALDRPFSIDGYGIGVGASIGVAVFPEHGLDAQTLLRRADVAMYVAKRGRRGAVVYTSEHDEHSPHRLVLLGEMRNAIEGGQFALSFQPIYDLRSRQLVRAAARPHWQHPRRGPLPPQEFIPLAEQTGLVGPLTRWLLGRALQTCADWHEADRAIGVAVHLPARALHDRGTAEMIAELLAAQDLPASALTLEIGEGALVSSPQRALETLMRLHTLGVRIAIAGFGAGYASLAYLKRLPVDELKISPAFVADRLRDANEPAARTAVDLAHNLGLQITAEGIADEETLAKLRAIGCDAAQGPLFGEQLEAAQVLARLPEG